jgi:tetrahydromethanopterin S-methyltransferase subunit G
MNAVDYKQMKEQIKNIKSTFKNIRKHIDGEKCGLNHKNSEEIEDLRNELEKTKSALDAAQQSIYQLIGGLYNPKTQGKTLEREINILLENHVDKAVAGESKWPTTRQGDANEKRIEELEKKVDACQQVIYQLIGGLFHRSIQPSQLELYERILYCEETSDELYAACELEEQGFITHQSMQNEERIDWLEYNMNMLVERIKKGKKLHKLY